MNDDNNIFQMVKGGKNTDTETLPSNAYMIVDMDGGEHYAEGFLLFTSQHVAVMRDVGSGAVPALVLPLTRVSHAELLEEEEFDD